MLKTFLKTEAILGRIIWTNKKIGVGSLNIFWPMTDTWSDWVVRVAILLIIIIVECFLLLQDQLDYWADFWPLFLWSNRDLLVLEVKNWSSFRSLARSEKIEIDLSYGLVPQTCRVSYVAVISLRKPIKLLIRSKLMHTIYIDIFHTGLTKWKGMMRFDKLDRDSVLTTSLKNTMTTLKGSSWYNIEDSLHGSNRVKRGGDGYGKRSNW